MFQIPADRPSVLVACESSGAVRDAFAARGWYAVSCDLDPSETPGLHHQGDVRELLSLPFRLMVAHPPCTHLSSSGARWFAAKRADGRQQAALDFFRELLAAPIPHRALENPVGIVGTQVRPASQWIEPWQHGHGETKKTGLWLENLPLLVPSNVVPGRENRIHKMGPGPNRGKDRSRTYPGIAAAMADQWGAYVEAQLSEGVAA